MTSPYDFGVAARVGLIRRPLFTQSGRSACSMSNARFRPKAVIGPWLGHLEKSAIVTLNSTRGNHMSFSDLAAIGSLVSGIAVLISLIYLGQQIRQNLKHTRALILQGRVDRVVSQHIAMANTDLVSAWISENGSTPTSEEIRRRQFQLQGTAYGVSWEDTFVQHETGLLGEEQFAEFRAQIGVILRNPGLHRYLSARPVPPGGPTKFHKFIGELLSETASEGTQV